MKKAGLPIHSQTRRAVCLLAVLLAGVATSSSRAQERVLTARRQAGKGPGGRDQERRVFQERHFPRNPSVLRGVHPGAIRRIQAGLRLCPTDGFNPAEKTLLEAMIAAKEMPVTIGVFVAPGDLPPTVNNTMGRRNRCYEYDGVSDNKVRFLVEELLPFVAKKFNLKLSTAAMTVASPAAAAAALRPSRPRGSGPTPSAASMPTAAASSLFAAVTSFPRWSASSRPSPSAPT